MYSLDHQMFTCFYSAWLRSPYLLGRRLTRDQPVSLYRELTISRIPPFIKICENTTRCRANIDGEKKHDSKAKPQNTSFASDTPAAYHDIDYSIDHTMEDRFDNLSDFSPWLVAHVDGLRNHQSGKEQLQYIRRSIIPRYQ